MRHRKTNSEKFKVECGTEEWSVHIFSNEENEYQIPGINIEKIEEGNAKKIHKDIIRIDNLNEILYQIVRSSKDKEKFHKGPLKVGKFDDEYELVESIFENDKSITSGKNWEEMWKTILENSYKAQVYFSKKWIRKYI